MRALESSNRRGPESTTVSTVLTSVTFILGYLSSQGTQAVAQDHHGPESECPTLYLLNVLPYPVREKESTGLILWDKAFELIPAGHLATEQINNSPDILPGRQLKLINIDSEACGINTISKGFTNVHRELVNFNRSCIVGVIGLFCSAVTSAISPIISHPNIGGYVHIVASTSPVHRYRGNHSQNNSKLFHIIESSSVFNEATLALMRTYNWQRITSINIDSDFYFLSTSVDFVRRISSKPELKLVARIHIIANNSPAHIMERFDVLRQKGARISYWSVGSPLAAFLLCTAYQRNFTWPEYVYIIQELDISRIVEIETSCTKEEVVTAMERVFILKYRLYVENDTELVSGVNYSEYEQLYSDRLKEFANTTNETFRKNVYANSMYDQVWSFALAVNNSLSSIESQNLSFEDYGLGKSVPTIPNILKGELKHVIFHGASGRIDFSKNQRSPTHVDIFQIQKGKPKLIGIYNPYDRNITLTEAAPLINDIPPDTFDTVHQLLPPWLGICLLTSQGILFGLITTNLFLILKWKDETDIKAISPYLSLLMMIGCYVLCVTSMIQIANRMFVLSTIAVTFLCYLETWTSLGTDLILAVLFLKLMRIYQIFRTFGKISKYWRDQCIFIYILAICLGKAVLVILWNSTDSIGVEVHKEYVKVPDQLPYYVDTVICYSSRVWLVATGLYSGVLLFLVVILAVATRHIKRENFKDTKKINAFIFSVLIVNISSIALRIFFVEVGNQIGDDIAEWLPSFSTPLLCQVCLFFPKILPLAFKLINIHNN